MKAICRGHNKGAYEIYFVLINNKENHNLSFSFSPPHYQCGTFVPCECKFLQGTPIFWRAGSGIGSYHCSHGPLHRRKGSYTKIKIPKFYHFEKPNITKNYCYGQ
jgi:hypothetical protein